MPGLLLGCPAQAATGKVSGPDDLMVVDCLLPGQIRMLGPRTTYVSHRRPVKTTALDCRIRSGEYVLQDQASLQSALNVWLPRAREGDPEAQTLTGEIFEKGMGVPPDYAAAATWYRRAAEQNYARAQIALGNLYERGLGVQKDPVTALNWYRRAAGLDAALELDTIPDVAPVNEARLQEIARLREELSAWRERTNLLQQELARSRLLLSGTEEEREALEQQLLALSAELEQSDDPMDSDVIRSLEAEREALSGELARARQNLEQQQQALDIALTALEQERNRSGRTAAELDASARELARGQKELADREQEIAALKARLDELQTVAGNAGNAAPPPEGATMSQGLLAGPSISLVDPLLKKTRGLVKVRVASNLSTRRIIGRVLAPAGLLSLTVNQKDVQTNPAGVFTAEVEVTAATREVAITAIDQQGKRADVQFVLAPAEAGKEDAGRKPPSAASVNFGRYFALLIGNDTYANLPDLKTPLNDVRSLDEILRSRYGFRTRLVLNATRYEILSAFNEVRETLTENDNLLVYYAGHGVMDEVNMRGYWLPVDAEADNSANWLSNVTVTDIFNIMSAKQILLVADSCYSGTLTRSAIARQKAGLTEAQRLNWLKTMAKKRARVVLTSGGLAPVLDGGGGAHSVFARSLLEVLAANEEILEGQSLYQGVAARVAYAAEKISFEQNPQYAPINRAGHEAGDFFLKPVF